MDDFTGPRPPNEGDDGDASGGGAWSAGSGAGGSGSGSGEPGWARGRWDRGERATGPVRELMTPLVEVLEALAGPEGLDDGSLTSVYLLVISAFALVAAALSRVTDLKRHPLFTLQALVIAGVVSVLVLTPFLLPYWFVSRDLGLVRSLGDAENFSAHWRAYLTTPARVHAWWSTGLADGNVLFPGAP